MSYRRADFRSSACRCILPALAVFAALSLAPTKALAVDPKATLRWVEYERGLAQAKKEGKFVVVDFYTSWCRDCKKMDKTTFSDTAITRKLRKGFVSVKVDGEKRPDIVSMHGGVFGYPTLLVLDKNGAEVCQRTGYMSVEEFSLFLDYAQTGAYKKTGYADYLKSRKD